MNDLIVDSSTLRDASAGLVAASTSLRLDATLTAPSEALRSAPVTGALQRSSTQQCARSDTAATTLRQLAHAPREAANLFEDTDRELARTG
jgi:hypothetical protein